MFPHLCIEHSGAEFAVQLFVIAIYYTMLTSLTCNALIYKWRAWPPAAVAQAWEPAQGNLAGAPSADSGSPLATGTHDDWSRRGFSDFSRL